MDTVERLRLIIDASTAGAARDLDALGIKATTTGQSFDRNFAKGGIASRALESFGLQGVATGKTMDTAFRAAGVGITAGIGIAVAKSITTFVDLASEVRNFQRVSGASAEDSSRFVAVLDDMEIAADVGSKAIFKLGREVESGGKGLAQYGVQVKRNKDGTRDLAGTLLNVADAYKATDDQATKNAIAFAAFGKPAAALIPILEQGRKGLKAFFEDAEKGHQIFTQKDLDDARQMELALDGLQDSLRGFAVQVGKAAVPAVTALTKSLTGVLDVSDKIGAGGFLGGLLAGGGIGLALGGPTGGLIGGGIGGVLGGTGGSTAGLIGAGIGTGAGAALGGAFGMPLLGAAAGGVAGGVIGNAAFGSVSVAGAVSSEQQDAIRKLNELTIAGKKNTDEYRQAMDVARGTSKLLASAQEDLGAALASKTEKQVAATSAVLASITADLNARGSILGVKEATLSYQQALEAAAEAGGADVEKNLAVERSLLNVEGAITKATIAAGQAAAAALGPNATAAQKSKADIEAQIATLDTLRKTLAPGSELSQFAEGFFANLQSKARDYNVNVNINRKLAPLTDADRAALDSVGIPYFATGGTVNSVPRGMPTLAVVHGGERILTEAQQRAGGGGGGGGGPSTVTIPIYLGGRQVAEVVASELSRAGGPQISQRAIA